MKMLRTLLMVGVVIAGVGWEGRAMADGANGSTYALTAFDGDFTLMGLNEQGRSFQAVYGSTTLFREAALEKFAPVDPCRTWAEAYNTYVQVNDTVGFNATLANMVTDSCLAKVHVDKKNPIWRVRSFEPVP